MNDSDRLARPSDARWRSRCQCWEAYDRCVYRERPRLNSTRLLRTTLVQRNLSRLTRRLKDIRLRPGNKPTTQT
jgi:hypothetical protein